MTLIESHGKVAVLEPAGAGYLTAAIIAGAAFLLAAVFSIGLG